MSFDLRLQCALKNNAGRGHLSVPGPRMPGSGRRGCLCWGLFPPVHPSVCLLGVVCLSGVHSSLASVGSTSQGVSQSLFRPLDHTGVELGVAAGMLGEVVTPHEALLTQGAAELLLPSVGPVVAGQFV